MLDYKHIVHALENGWDVVNFGKVQFEDHQLYFGHGTDNALDEALALALHALNCSYEEADTRMQDTLSLEEKRAVVALYKARIETRKPASYLTNKAYFCGLEFYVDETVLIPRSPIAELIENQFMPWINPEKVGSILELCTGSACIAIALAYAFEHAHIDATDISADVLNIAKINSKTHRMDERVSFYQGDLFQAIEKKKYDVIVTNPPYVSEDELNALPQEYGHEPSLALKAADEGLALVDIILHEAKDYLTQQGILIVEVGYTEQALVKKYPNIPFTWLSFEKGGEGVFLLSYKDLIQYF